MGKEKIIYAHNLISYLFTRFQLAKKYLHYYLTASNGKGHGIHSPFVFNFIIKVLNDKKNYACYALIENRRKELLNDTTAIEVEDFGAGSSVINTNQRVVKNIAQSSLKPKKFSQLLFRIVQYYKPGTMLELGTSFGITTAYRGVCGGRFCVGRGLSIARTGLRTGCGNWRRSSVSTFAVFR